MNGKRFAWQGVVKLPFIDETRLLGETKKLEHTLTEEERVRNSVMQDLLYVHVNHPLGAQIALYYKCYFELDVEERVPCKIDPSTSDGMNGYLWLSKRNGYIQVFPSPIKGLGDVENNQVLLSNFLLQCCIFEPSIPPAYSRTSQGRQRYQGRSRWPCFGRSSSSASQEHAADQTSLLCSVCQPTFPTQYDLGLQDMKEWLQLPNKQKERDGILVQDQVFRIELWFGFRNGVSGSRIEAPRRPQDPTPSSSKAGNSNDLTQHHMIEEKRWNSRVQQDQISNVKRRDDLRSGESGFRIEDGTSYRLSSQMPSKSSETGSSNDVSTAAHEEERREIQFK
ncbi:hypothetical protein Scep_009555 [Stephania cephalantha]|uniref:Xrn1 helical domain-containing protein n=1 Tax=Stephania cephalantha TaxID=152367 RepID=A0AAP0JU24_9MAGN